MNTRRSVTILGLWLALACVLVMLPGSNFNPALAQSGTGDGPAGKFELQRAPGSDQKAPLKADWYVAKSQDQTVVIPRSTSAGFANGDFENGRDGSWTEYSSHGWDVIVDSMPVAPRSGTWAAWLGGDHDDISYISQSFTVPSNASILRIWLWIASEDDCGRDYGWVKLNGDTVGTLDLCDANDTSGWVAGTVDLGAYVGQTFTLEIRVETNGSLNSNLYVDDVEFTAAGGDSLTYIPVTLKNYWSGYFDDFSDPNSGWISDDNRYLRYGYLNGEYQYYVKMEHVGLGISPGPADGRDLYLPSDYRVEVDARTVSAAAGTYGLRFGIEYSSDSREFYQVVVWPPSGEFILDKRMMNGSWSTLVEWTYSSAINQGSGSNHIEVERVGSKIEVYINGSEVADVYDSSFLGSGRDAGLVVYSYDDVPVDVRFDNFGAWPP